MTAHDISDKKIIFWEDQGFVQYSIAYWLQKKLNCKMYAIFDITDRTKPFFKNQKLVNFQKIWFFHDHISQNKKPDLEYLKSIEEKYDIFLWQIAANERIFYDFYDFHKFSENEVLSIIEQECRLFEQILDDVKPDFLVTTTNMSHNHIFFKMCKAKGIHILFLASSRQSGKAMISENTDSLPSRLAPPSLEKERSFIELQNYIKKHSRFNEMKDFLSGFSTSKYDLFKAAIEFLIISNNSNEKTHFTYYGRTKFQVLTSSIKDKFKTRSRGKYIESHFKKNIPDEKFIFFPLQLEPERTLLLDAPFFTNQLEIIRNVAKSLPIGYKLFVKEQAAMVTRSWRSVDWYKQLAKIPNVVLIHYSLPPDELLKKCSLVITITGTAGFDAAFYEKPSIVFGDVSYSKLSCVHKLENMNELPRVIREQIKKKPDLSELNNLINLLENNSFEFQRNKFLSHVSTHFYFKGNLVDVEISDKQMETFQKMNKEILSPVIDEHVKKINQYIMEENNCK